MTTLRLFNLEDVPGLRVRVKQVVDNCVIEIYVDADELHQSCRRDPSVHDTGEKTGREESEEDGEAAKQLP
jgi:hypothetical protein